MNPIPFLAEHRALNAAAVAAYMGLIFLGSSMSGTGVPSTFGHYVSLLHIPEYAVLSALVYPLFMGKRHPLPLAIFICVLYGISDEMHQSFVPGRDTSPLDIIYDGVGATLGALLSRRWGGSR